MNSDNGARLSFFFHKLAEELVTELNAHTALIEKLAARIYDLENDGLRKTVGILSDRIDEANGKIRGLELKTSQEVSIKIDGDIGERLDAFEGRISDLETSIEDFITEDGVEERIETAISEAISDKVSDLDLEEKISEHINNLTFTVTVD